jgi:ATP-dependent 26S proteasome regulatory subunit
LKHKTWQKVEVASLKTNAIPPDPFEKLVTPNPKYKVVVESMVDTYLDGVQFSDIVKDKGRGLIILLRGSPGTGKTLTAGKFLPG